MTIQARHRTLFLILLLGFFLRAYHLNFPSIGYHNMKENEYLSIAVNMENKQDYSTRSVFFFNGFSERPTMKEYIQFPLIPYQIIFAWRLFGHNLLAPRLINVIFGIASIGLIYLIYFILSGSVIWALFSAFLMAMLPLAVFFSRNLQPESPALFFMLLGNYFYLKFIFKPINRKYLFWGGAYDRRGKPL